MNSRALSALKSTISPMFTPPRNDPPGGPVSTTKRRSSSCRSFSSACTSAAVNARPMMLTFFSPCMVTVATPFFFTTLTPTDWAIRPPGKTHCSTRKHHDTKERRVYQIKPFVSLCLRVEKLPLLVPVPPHQVGNPLALHLAGEVAGARLVVKGTERHGE